MRRPNNKATIVIPRGDSRSFLTTFTDEDGNAIDITGDTVYFTVKKNLADANVDAEIYKEITSHTDPTNGQTTISLTASDTDLDPGQYYYDIQRVSGSEVKSTYKQLFIVDQDVTL